MGDLKAVLADHVSVTEAHNDYLAKTCAMVAGIALPTKNSIFDITPPLLEETLPISQMSKVKNQERKRTVGTKSISNNSQVPSENMLQSNTFSNVSDGAISISQAITLSSTMVSIVSSMYGSSVNLDPLHKNASRTLYVGNLERKVTDERLKTKFGVFGYILDVDVKNRDTPSPFAFIQFTNINSVVSAIRACNPNKSTVLSNSLVSSGPTVMNLSEICPDGSIASSSGNTLKSVKVLYNF